MDKISLENAIKGEAEQAIRDISLKEAEDIWKLDDAYAAEIDAFKKDIQTQTDARIRQESSKAENRTRLDIKKLKLRNLEVFINSAVEEAMKEIRDNPHYKKYLLGAITDAISRIPEAAEVRLKREDLIYEKEIRDSLKTAGKGMDAIITEDAGIKWGGCIVVDRSVGRIFDSTIERIYFRKSPQIHREVMKMLGNYPRKAT